MYEITHQTNDDEFYLFQEYYDNPEKCGVILEIHAEREEHKNNIAKFELDINKIYFNPKTQFCFFYKDGIIVFPVHLELFQTENNKAFEQFKEAYQNQIQHQKEYLENGKYEKILALQNEQTTVMTLEKIIDKIKEDKKYEVIAQVYQRSERGFDRIIKLLFQNLEHSGEKRINRISSLKTDSEGYVKVYRGQESKSTDKDEAYSWTTDINTAIFFASRYTMDGVIYEGKVHINDVIDNFKGSENEVIAKNVKIKAFKTISTKKALESIDGTDYLDVFHKYRNYLLDIIDMGFEYKDGIHGKLHATRVTVTSMFLAKELGVQRKEDIEILAISAIFHDVGRIDDFEDPNHGLRSWIKAQPFIKILMMSNMKDIEIIRFIIENHDVGDIQAKSVLKSYDIKNKDRAWKLYSILCDADALDRIRIKDIDLNYLRYEVSKKYLIVAKHLLEYVKIPL